jgi:hypothetical protein
MRLHKTRLRSVVPPPGWAGGMSGRFQPLCYECDNLPVGQTGIVIKRLGRVIHREGSSGDLVVAVVERDRNGSSPRGDRRVTRQRPGTRLGLEEIPGCFYLTA